MKLSGTFEKIAALMRPGVIHRDDLVLDEALASADLGGGADLGADRALGARTDSDLGAASDLDAGIGVGGESRAKSDRIKNVDEHESPRSSRDTKQATNGAVAINGATPKIRTGGAYTNAEGRVTLGTLLELLGSKSTSLVCLFLVGPFLQPVPLLGLSTPVGIIIALHGIAISFNTKPWLPTRLANLTLPATTVEKIATNLSRLFHKIEFLTSPRLSTFALQNPFRFTNGMLLCLAGLFLALPLPIPFSNGVPAVLIFLVSLSHAEEDGLLAILAYVYFIGLVVSGSLLGEVIVKWFVELF